MIDIKDLRISNWVYKNIFVPNQYFQITKGFEIDSADDPIIDYQPIPLTPDILVNCGFTELSSAWFEKDGVKILFGYTKEYGDFFHYTQEDELVVSPAFKSVHQLQNLYYSLTGKELEITL